MSIFVNDLERIREKQPLDNYMPLELPTFELLDDYCQGLYNSGQLEVVDSPKIRAYMSQLRQQDLAREAFVGISDYLFDELAQATMGTDPNELFAKVSYDPSVKLAVSIRGGEAMVEPFKKQGVLDKGFITQFRDDTPESNIISEPRKLGHYRGRRAIAVDPMLATGNSMADLIREVRERGAIAVTAVVAFASPQGIYQLSRLDGVDRIVSLPLEAGLTAPDSEGKHGNYLVGGVGKTAMLGDFGKRYFGPEDGEDDEDQPLIEAALVS